jgi:choline dehydrogenase
MTTYDYIIVGAGSAGCVLANRLSADRANRVLLVEAGSRDTSMMIHMPAGLAQTVPPDKGSALNWHFWTEPQAHLDGRRLYWPRGKTLGGSSSINGMVYIRGHSSDYDRWAQMGCTGWGWDGVLPYFRKSESSERGADEWHGGDGPLRTSTRAMPSPLIDAFLSACAEAGYALTDDFNGPAFEGAGRYDSTTKDGERWSAARGYLTPVLNRPNLDVLTDVLVERVTFEGRRASGIAYRQRGGSKAVTARETIVCGGAINSPQLLMLSGIGPADHLRAHGIAIVHDAPDVGGNMQDHLDVIVQWTCTQPITLNRNAHLHNKLLALGRWMFGRAGSGSYMPTPAGAFLSTRDGLAAPDIQLHFMPVIGQPHGRGTMGAEHGYSMHMCQLRPESRGSIRLNSADPAAHPAIDPNYLSAPGDLETMLAGIAITRRIGQMPALAPYRGKEVWPGEAVQSRDAVIAALKAWAETIYHPVGTCRMGPDERAVVGLDLRVKGVAGLRVVDASIMPTLISGNTNAPTIMIAEKASDAILADAKQALAA